MQTATPAEEKDDDGTQWNLHGAAQWRGPEMQQAAIANMDKVSIHSEATDGVVVPVVSVPWESPLANQGTLVHHFEMLNSRIRSLGVKMGPKRDNHTPNQGLARTHSECGQKELESVYRSYELGCYENYRTNDDD